MGYGIAASRPRMDLRFARGDYGAAAGYRGDPAQWPRLSPLYRGDPFIGGLVRGIAGLAEKILPGPFGAAAGAVRGILSPERKAAPVLPQAPVSGGPGGMQGAFQVPGTALMPPAAAAAAMQVAPGMACPSGYHANKSDYFLKDGTYVAEGTRCVRNRRMNPLNPRALRRGISRQKGFIGLAKKAMKGTNYTVTTRGARSRAPQRIAISERGPGSVSVRQLPPGRG